MNTKSSQFRWYLAFIMFAISFLSYMDRVNLSVATPAIMGEFGFSKINMGLLQTAFFVGYAMMQIPGGIMAERFGCRRVVAAAVTFWSMFTSLTAVCNSFTMFATVRALFGVGEGPLAPSFGRFIYRWFHTNEKARGSACFLGGMFIGPVIGPAVTVALMLAFGWRSVFLIFGAAGLVLALSWYWFVRESPRESKYVSAAEADYIETGVTPAQEQKNAPWRNFMTSSQFWAIGIQFFITDYIMYVFLAWLPLYLMEAQHFSLTSMGIAASLPWAALCLVTFATGFISDKLVGSGLSKHKARTLFGMTGLAICCIALYLGAVAADPWWNVFWLTVSLGSLGFTFNAAWAACIDIGGEFSGSVSGWMNFWGNLGGAAAPIFTAWVATSYGWQAAILATAALAIIGIGAWVAVKPDLPLLMRYAKEQSAGSGLGNKAAS
ncbi:MAG: MFS transporter [Veillonellales bacterium]